MKFYWRMTPDEQYKSKHIEVISEIADYAESIDKNIEESTAALGDISGDINNFITKFDVEIFSKISKTLDDLGSSMKRDNIDSKKATTDKKKPPTDIAGLKDIPSIIQGLAAFTPGVQENANAFIKFVESYLSKIFYKVAEVDKDDVSKASMAVASIAQVSGKLTPLAQDIIKSAALFQIAKPLIPIITSSVNQIIRAIASGISEDDAKRFKEISGTLSVAGKGIFELAKYLAISTPLLILGLPGLLILRMTAGIISKTFKIFAENKDDINSGASTLKNMGLALLFFAGGLALAVLIISTMSAGDAFAGTLILMGTIGIAALGFALIGNFAPQIKKGAIATMFMAGSMLLFAIGLRVATALLPPITQVLMLSLSLVLIGGVFALAGLVWSYIGLGALAFALVGLSLLLLSFPLASIAQVLNKYPNVMWQLPVTLLGIGVVFAAAGIPIVAAFIALGAVALGLAAGALWVLSRSLLNFAEADLTMEDCYILKEAIKSVVEGIGTAFEKLSMKQILSLPLAIPAIATMGIALTGISLGIRSWVKYGRGWTTQDAVLVKKTIESLSEAFAVAGSTEGMSSLFGFPVGRNDVQRGIESTMEMGENLKYLAEAIAKWDELKLTREKVQELANQMSSVLTVIPAVFADIGLRERNSSNQMDVFGVKFGVPFTSTDTELGIESTMEIGNNLKNLAEGILAWKDMDMDQATAQLIADNISMVLGLVPGVFAQLGRQIRETSSNQMDLGFVTFGFPFTSTDVELGISSTMDMGENLNKMAEGLLAWKAGGEKGLTNKVLFGTDAVSADMEPLPGSILHTIMSILGVLPMAFSEIGKINRETSTRFLGIELAQGDIEAGVELVGGLGAPLQLIMGIITQTKETLDAVGGGYAFRQMGNDIGSAFKNFVWQIADGFYYIEDQMDADDVAQGAEALEKGLGVLQMIQGTMNEQMNIVKQMGGGEAGGMMGGGSGYIGNAQSVGKAFKMFLEEIADGFYYIEDQMDADDVAQGAEALESGVETLKLITTLIEQSQYLAANMGAENYRDLVSKMGEGISWFIEYIGEGMAHIGGGGIDADQVEQGVSAISSTVDILKVMNEIIMGADENYAEKARLAGLSTSKFIDSIYSPKMLESADQMDMIANSVKKMLDNMVEYFKVITSYTAEDFQTYFKWVDSLKIIENADIELPDVEKLKEKKEEVPGMPTPFEEEEEGEEKEAKDLVDVLKQLKAAIDAAATVMANVATTYNTEQTAVNALTTLLTRTGVKTYE